MPKIDKRVSRVVDSARDQLVYLTQDYLDGEVSLKGWQRQAAEIIKQLHFTVGMAGYGDDFNDEARNYLNQRVAKQIGYLFNFAGQVARGEQAEDESMLSRIGMYADAGLHTYLNAERHAEDGDAQMERRVLGEADNHCACCLAEADKGWQPFGTLAELGECQCISNCLCSFEFSYKPVAPGEEEPAEAEEEEPIASVTIHGKHGKTRDIHIYEGGSWRDAGQPAGVATAARPTAQVAQPSTRRQQAAPKKSLPGRVWKHVKSWLSFSAEELDYLKADEAEFSERLRDLRPALFEGDADKGTRIPLPIARDAFGYQADNTGSKQCEQCIMWVPDKMRCTVHGEDEPVYKFSSCDYYIHGAPVAGRKCSQLLTPEESGLVHRQVRCENCWFLDRGGAEGSIHCDLFEKLNKMRPKMFNLEEAVEPGGCCNAQTPKTKEDLTDFSYKGKVGIHIVGDKKSALETAPRAGKYDPTAPGTQAHTDTRRRVERWLVDKAAEHGSKPKGLGGPDFDLAISEMLRGTKTLGEVFTEFVGFSDDNEEESPKKWAQSEETGRPAGFSANGLIEVPDIRQRDSYSCGAACAAAVGMHFRVGPDKLDDWKLALGTTEKTSTKPQAIIDYLSSLGLNVTARQNMSLDDLEYHLQRGEPVICCIQEYGVPSKQASLKYGHYVVVIGRALGQVIVQDPSIMNVVTGGHEITHNLPDELVAEAEEFVYLYGSDSNARA